MVATDPLVAARIVSVGNRPGAAWAEGMRVHLPRSLLTRTGWRLTGDGDLRIPDSPAAVMPEDATLLRESRAFTDLPPASARLPFSYHAIPGWVRTFAASAIGRWNRTRIDQWARFPEWPVDLSADFVADLCSAAAPGSRPHPVPVIVTHDIDSSEGLSNLVSRFLPLEEAAGARSTSYIVPCSWPIDHARVAELVQRGHDTGVHGYDHSNKTPFATAEERARRLDAARAFSDRYEAVGYRAPSLLRTRALLRDLSTRYRYDSSIPTSGGLFPSPNNGCATARPFRLENIVELPISLPRDGMLRFLGYSPREILRLWIDCADLVARSGGVVVLLTHCERRFSGNAAMLDAYHQFLVRAQSDRAVRVQ